MRFLGREQELSALEREYKRDGGFVVVYGRRRVGKTTLIKEFIKGKNAMYFLANEESDRQNLNKFTEKVADFTQQPHLAGSRLESWQSAFRMLAAAALCRIPAGIPRQIICGTDRTLCSDRRCAEVY